MGAQMLSSNQKQKEWIAFQDPNIFYIGFPYPWELGEISGREFFKKELTNIINAKNIDTSTDICGFMLETFQGWGAVFYPDDFVEEIRELCDKHNILLCFDEMQAGFGRTGKNFGYEHYNVSADLICVGKGMASGFPVSGVIGSAKVMDLPAVGEMSSTHSANPLACASGLATIEEIEHRSLVERSKTLGELFHIKLNELKKTFPDRISDVLGKGLLAAIHFNHNGKPLSAFASEVCERCLRKGVLVVHTGRESIKLAPPLTITEDALKEGIGVIEDAIREVIEKSK
jgi:4-aminobutyrate aminotransferase-like enzyme